MNEAVQGNEVMDRRWFAGFWRRFFALLADLALLFLLLKILALIENYGYVRVVEGTILDAKGEKLHEIQTLFSLLHSALTLILPLAYFTLCEASRFQATAGKKLFGVLIMDRSWRRISPGRSLARNLFKPFSALPLFLGFLLTVFTPKRQALHDFLSGTLAVRRKYIL